MKRHDILYETAKCRNRRIFREMQKNLGSKNQITKRQYAAEGGIPAITGPGEIIVRSRNQGFDAIDQRGKSWFGSCCDDADNDVRYDAFYDARFDSRFGARRRDRGNLWATPGYARTTRSRHDDKLGFENLGFELKTTGVAFGYDRSFGGRSFAGIAAMFDRPQYSSGKTGIKADDMSLALYGGIKPAGVELTGRVGYGYARFDQRRGVEDERYASKYDGHSLFVGLGASRLISLCHPSFCLRPGVHYDFLGLTTAGFHERGGNFYGAGSQNGGGNGGTYALRVEDHTRNLHRLKLGLDAQWQPSWRFIATSELYYLGLFGDRSARTTASFVNDPANNGGGNPANAFAVTGYALEQNNVGLGLHLRLPFDRCELGAGYTALLARRTAAQNVALNAVWRF